MREGGDISGALLSKVRVMREGAARTLTHYAPCRESLRLDERFQTGTAQDMGNVPLLSLDEGETGVALVQLTIEIEDHLEARAVEKPYPTEVQRQAPAALRDRRQFRVQFRRGLEVQITA